MYPVGACHLEDIVQKLGKGMSSSEDSDSDWKDHDKERGSRGAETNSPTFLEHSSEQKKAMKAHHRGKHPPVRKAQTEVLSPLDTSLKGSYISPKKPSLHNKLTSEADHLCVEENIVYINFKTANAESHAHRNTRVELLKMSDEKALATEQKEIGTVACRDDTSNDYSRGDPEGKSTEENIAGSDSESDDGYVTVRSRISVDSVALKKPPPDKSSHDKSGLEVEAVYSNFPIRTELIPFSVHNGDMTTLKSDLKNEGDYCKLLPLDTMQEKEPPKIFYSFTVRQVYDCFRYCGLEQVATTCKAGKLDGAFFQHLMNDNFSELLSKEPFNLTPLDTFKVKAIISGWRPRESLKKLQS